MADIDPNDSVQDEQFGKSEITNGSVDPENAKKLQETDESPQDNLSEDKSTGGKEQPTERAEDSIIKNNEDTEANNTDDAVAESESDDVDKTDTDREKKKIGETVKKKTGKDESEKDSEDEKEEPVKEKKEKAVKKDTKEKESAKNEKEEEEEEEVKSESMEETDKEEKEEKEKAASETKKKEEKVDYASLSPGELIEEFRRLIDTEQIGEIRDTLESIKNYFYKYIHTKNETIRKKFLKEGGNPEDFKPEESEEEKIFKELFENYKLKKASFNRNLEAEKQDNLKKKYQVIEELKELTKGQESLNKTFHEFRELQDRWRSIGLVPQASLKDLWETYHYYVEAFYDYIKINKELRDLDLRKNLESKTNLCEKAEELLLEPSVVEAFRLLQELHERWREIGPVPPEKKSEIWERFKAATSKINRRHQDYFVNLKKEQKKNLEAKTVLCEKAEEIASVEPEDFKEWEKKSKELIEIQKVWKTIGFAPKKHNTRIYQRFREACDSFFNKKREYFAQSKEEQENNLQLKIDLCVLAESLAESTDWKKTTDDLIELQRQWKEVGPVPFKQSDKVWKRFRAACDTFFNNKSKFYSNIDDTYENNLVRKKKIIEKIKAFKPTGDPKKVLSELKKLQREWTGIGYVPLKNKNEIQEEYRNAINQKFDELKVDESEKSLIKFRSRVENILTKPNAENRLRMERDKFINKIKQLESDIIVWENNIGFFTESKNADSMITEVKEKIELAKEKIDILKEKIVIIDEFD